MHPIPVTCTLCKLVGNTVDVPHPLAQVGASRTAVPPSRSYALLKTLTTYVIAFLLPTIAADEWLLQGQPDLELSGLCHKEPKM